MKLIESESLARLAKSDHGVLATIHAARGVDAVPVVFSVDDGFVAVPIDQVKPKSSPKLQRERNLEADPRATLLIDHWDPDDWSELWWVRAELRWETSVADDVALQLANQLSERFAQYRDKPFHRLLVFRIVRLSGWAGTSE